MIRLALSGKRIRSRIFRQPPGSQSNRDGHCKVFESGRVSCTVGSQALPY